MPRRRCGSALVGLNHISTVSQDTLLVGREGGGGERAHGSDSKRVWLWGGQSFEAIDRIQAILGSGRLET